MADLIETSSKETKSDFYSPNNLTTLQDYTQLWRSKSSSKALRSRTRHKWNIDIDFYNEIVLTDPIINDSISSVPEDEITSVPKESRNINYEDSESLINNVFNTRDFIINESWDYNEIIKSRIVSSDNEYVSLDCIVDIETMHFEHRQFPKSLFSNFKTLDAGSLVMINIKSNPGSLRVDVYPGEGMINPELFNINDDIENLRKRDIETSLRGEW